MCKDMMVIFGGIHEVTQELNDVVALNLNQNKWIVLFEETGATSPSRLAQHLNNASPESSPMPGSRFSGGNTGSNVKRFDTYGKASAAPGSSMKDFNRPNTV